MRTIPHFIRLRDFDDRQIEDVLDLAMRIKRGVSRAELAGRSVGLLFFRGSLRTRTSLEVALSQLGGHTVNLTASSDFWELEARTGTVMDGSSPEHIKDAATVLSSYVNALAIRPAPAGKSWDVDRRDEGISAWAACSKVPVINMESVLWHPLQALADLMTLRETLGDLQGKRLAICWTPSPTPAGPAVVHSTLHAALRSGMRVTMAHPPGYELDEGVMKEAREIALAKNTELVTGVSAAEAVEGTHVVYARSWNSLEVYGNPTLEASRVARSTSWTIDSKLIGLGDDALLMHPMPVRRNLEVTDEVLDGPRSLIYRQAENRLHTQKGLLSLLLRG
ncbi:MAG: N-acetylornithine carbamoyltransferase [Chlamydiales bacterium]|jgi:N-acetylornithine carbamoyltransferase